MWLSNSGVFQHLFIMNKRQLMSVALCRADLVESSVRDLEEKLIRLAANFRSQETQHVIHEVRKQVEEIRVRLVRLLPYLKSLEMECSLSKENEDPNGTATEEKKDEEKVPKMAKSALKSIESINNATD